MPRSMTSGSRVPRNTSRSKPFRTAVTAEPKRATNLSTTASSSRWQGWVAPPKYPEKWRRLYFGLRASARAKNYCEDQDRFWPRHDGSGGRGRRELLVDRRHLRVARLGLAVVFRAGERSDLRSPRLDGGDRGTHPAAEVRTQRAGGAGSQSGAARQGARHDRRALEGTAGDRLRARRRGCPRAAS